MDTFLSSLSTLQITFLCYTVLYSILYTILYTVLYTILESLLYTLLYTILYIMSYKKIKVICLFSEEHYPSYLLYNVMNNTIYTLLNTLLCTVLNTVQYTVQKPLSASRKKFIHWGTLFLLPVGDIEQFTVLCTEHFNVNFFKFNLVWRN